MHNFIRAQHGRYLARFAHEREVPCHVRPVEGDGEEEANACHRGIDTRRTHTGLRLMQLEASQVFGCRGIRRAAKESREGQDVTDIVVARLLDEIAHHHVLDHAPAQRADGLLAHWGAPHLEVDNTPIVGSRRSAHTSSSLVIHLRSYPQGSPAKRVRSWVESGHSRSIFQLRRFRHQSRRKAFSG